MDQMPEGTRAIVNQAVEEAGQSLFAAADVPLARTDELLAAVQGPAIRAVLEARIEQIVRHGHDREHDEMLPITRLPQLAREQLSMALDTSLTAGERRDLRVARRRLARSAAMCLAAIDRLDMLTDKRRSA